jgi:flagellar protein FlaG
MAVTALGPGAVPELYLAVSLATKPGVQTSNATTQQAGESRVPSTPATPDQRTLAKAIAFANSVTRLFNTRLSFSYDERIKQVVIKVIENGTEEVLRQFPPEELIALHLQLKEQVQGIILNRVG